MQNSTQLIVRILRAAFDQKPQKYTEIYRFCWLWTTKCVRYLAKH